MRDFYRDSLTICWNDSREGSGCILEFGADSRLVAARIDLFPDHPREAPSLAHELLHLDLYAGGYTAVDLSAFKDKELRLIKGARNDVEHELMFSAFVAMEFDGRDFTRCGRSSAARLDRREEIDDPRTALGRKARFLTLSLPYSKVDSDLRGSFRDRVARRSGPKSEYVGKHELDSIVRWIDRGLFRYQDTDFREFNSLLRILGLPSVEGHRYTRGNWVRQSPVIHSNRE